MAEEASLPVGEVAALTAAVVTVAAGCNLATKATRNNDDPSPTESSPPPSSRVNIAITVNGKLEEGSVLPTTPLLEFLRESLRLTGTKYGCGENQCGACTVLLDDRPVRSCTRKAHTCDGMTVTTIEGVRDGSTLHPVQQAFLDEQAMQCGFCTPGMVMAAIGLLRANKAPNDEDITAAMTRNLCRCGTYPRIARAVRRAAGLALPSEEEAE